MYKRMHAHVMLSVQLYKLVRPLDSVTQLVFVGAIQPPGVAPGSVVYVIVGFNRARGDWLMKCIP